MAGFKESLIIYAVKCDTNLFISVFASDKFDTLLPENAVSKAIKQMLPLLLDELRWCMMNIHSVVCELLFLF